MTHYDFSKGFSFSNFYMHKWNDTFKQTIEDIKSLIKENNLICKSCEYYLENSDNDLVLKIINEKKEKIDLIKVENIQNYSINNIFEYLNLNYIQRIINKKVMKDTSKFSINKIIINEYFIQNYLKLDSLNNLFINKDNVSKILENHFIKIFTSNTMKSAFKEISENISNNTGYYDFLNDNDLKQY